MEHFTETNGDTYATLAGILIVQAQSAYDTTAPVFGASRERSARFVTAMIGKCTQAGFKQGGVLETLIAQGDFSPRTVSIAEGATDALGDATAKNAALAQVFEEVYGVPVRFVKPGDEQ
jgi:hypothetical protein